jgi:putative membrane protein
MNRLPFLWLVAAMSTGSALAQAPASGGAAASGGATATAPAAGKSAPAARIDRGDSKMLTDLIEANIAEIETGKLALEKSQDAQVKAFAQRMVDDHTSALKEVQALAESKGVKAKDETDMAHKAVAAALKALKGDTFDKQYMKRVGVGDHQRTVKLLQKMQKDAKDADLKALAAKMLPTVQQHLHTAEQQAKVTTARK